MTAGSLDTFRARRQDAPLEIVRDSAEWRPVVRLIDTWAKEKLHAQSGYSTQELDTYSWIRGIRFPTVLREWWRLAGRHPFVQPGLLPDNAFFFTPTCPLLLERADFLPIAVDDTQDWSLNGIHADFLSDPDPVIHGINSTIGPDTCPSLDWYKGEFIATGLRVPSLVFATLVYHLFERSPLVCDEAIYLKVDRARLQGGQADDRLVQSLNLTCFPNDTLVGDIYTDGDIIYW